MPDYMHNQEDFIDQLEEILEEIRQSFTTPAPPKIGGEPAILLLRLMPVSLA
jgi:hypothetical protein